MFTDLFQAALQRLKSLEGIGSWCRGMSQGGYVGTGGKNMAVVK